MDESIFADSIVTIEVGPNKQPFQASKALLCLRSPFFKAAFTGNFKETSQHSILLEEDSPDAFKLFLEWAYHTNISRTRDIRDTWIYYLNGYVLAEKLLVPELQNKAMDAMLDLRSIHGLEGLPETESQKVTKLCSPFALVVGTNLYLHLGLEE